MNRASMVSHGRARPCGDTPSERRLRMPIATSSVEALRRPLESTGECLRRLLQHRGVARRGVVHRPFRFASAFGPRQVVPPPVSAPGRSVEPISPRGGALRRVGPTFAECPRACAAEIAGRGITASITNGDGEAAINDKTKRGARRWSGHAFGRPPRRGKPPRQQPPHAPTDGRRREDPTDAPVSRTIGTRRSPPSARPAGRLTGTTRPRGEAVQQASPVFGIEVHRLAAAVKNVGNGLMAPIHRPFRAVTHEGRSPQIIEQNTHETGRNNVWKCQSRSSVT